LTWVFASKNGGNGFLESGGVAGAPEHES
jgi:hypothetical protein